MKKVKRALAMALAATLTFTSVQTNWSVVAYAAGAGDTETEFSEALTWDADTVEADYGYEVSGSNTIVDETEYSGKSQYVNNISMPLDDDMISIDTNALGEILDVDAGDLDNLSIGDFSFSYQWSKAGDDGIFEEIEDEDGDSYGVYDYITNANLSTTYRCVAVVTEIEGIEVPEDANLALIYDRVYTYTGPTEDKIESGEESIDDYFDIDDFSAQQETVEFETKNESKSPESFYVYSEDGELNYILSCVYQDGTDEELESEEGVSYLSNSSIDRFTYTRGGKEVDYYKLHVDFMYGEQLLQSVDKIYNLTYIGITKADVDQNPEILNEYFDGLDTLQDGELNYADTDSSKWVNCDVSSNYSYYSYVAMDYEWTAHAGELTESVSQRTGVSNISARNLYCNYDFEVTDEENGGTVIETKQVDYYELTVTFYYGGEEIAARTAKYEVGFNPIVINSKSESPFMARNGETKRLYVDAEQSEESDENIGTITYQWYQVKNGTSTIMEGENLSEIFVKVTDYNTSYKCVVSATKLNEAYPDMKIKELSAEFQPGEATGYHLKAIDEYQEAYLGDAAVFSVKTAVDPGYTLNYKWEKASYDDEYNVIYTEKSNGISSEYKIDQTKEEDFVSVYDGNLGRRFTHRLTVTVKKGTQEADRSYYYFSLRKLEDEPYTIDTNLYIEYEREKIVEKGEDVELYLKSEVKDSSYTIEKTWYKKLADIDYVAETDEDGNYVYNDDGSLKYKTADPNVTVPGTSGKEEEHVDYSSGVYNPDYGYIYTRKTVTYYEKLTAKENDSVYTIAGKDASGKINDIRGRYSVDVKITREEEEEEYTTNYSYGIILVYDSGLQAYAKTAEIRTSVGKAASLEVVASNKNESLYEIAYQWQKWDEDAQEYKDLAGAVESAYEIKSLTANDFGGYRVIVSDSSDADAIRVYFSLYELNDEQPEPHFYTPERSYFNKSMGDTVDLEVKADIPASVKVDYSWYCAERYLEYDYWWNEHTDYDWQILNEESPAYKFQISSEEDFRLYKCVARYKLYGRYEENTFYYYVEDALTISLERTTAETQYKQIGDSVSYGVRYKTASSEIKDEDVKYQWFDDEGNEIEGATGAAYTVNSLEAKDFGTIYCSVTYSDRNMPKRISFTTRLYSDVTVVDGDTIYTETGSDVVLKPEIKNPSNRALTYQWYFYRQGIIYGATAETYTISKIGENQFGRYGCRIYDGDVLLDTYAVDVAKAVSEDEDKNVVIEEYEQNVSVVSGKSAVFAVNAKSDSSLELSYQWYYSTDYDDDEYRAIGGAVSASYTIPYALPSMEGTYRCTVTDSEGNCASAYFYLSVDSNLEVDSGYRNDYDLIGYQTTIGSDVTLKAAASIDSDYKIFYQWYKGDDVSDRTAIYGATAAEYKLSNITMEDIGYYTCKVTDANGSVKYLHYQVYINTGLVVEPSMKYPREASDGSVQMYVKATANEGEKISYQWAKYDSELGKYVDLNGAAAASYKIAGVTKDTIGRYMCKVSTSGESYSYDYELKTFYNTSQSRDYAEQNDSFTLTTSMVNAEKDAQYTYVWYAQDPVTGSQKKVNSTTASYTGKAPVIKMNSSLKGFAEVGYSCEIYKDGKYVREEEFALNVFPAITYETKTLPQTSHPFDKRVDVKAYKIDKASQIKITLDTKSEEVLVIDANGKGHWMDGKIGNGLTLSGGSAIFIAYGGDGIGYGYKVSSIVDPTAGSVVNPPAGGAVNPPAGGTVNPPAGGVVNPPVNTGKKVPAKGTKYTYKNVVYQVTKSASANGTVSAVGVKAKTITSASIQKTVKIDGYTFKVTAVGAKAFNGCTKMTKVTIGANVTSIGKEAFKGCSKLNSVSIGSNVTSIGERAFSGCKKIKSITLGAKVTSIGKEAFKNCSALKTITIKTTKLTSKKVGSNAFKGINAKATIKVPGKQLSNYKKLLKSKGAGSKVKYKKL